jgi:hypothetical protein
LKAHSSSIEPPPLPMIITSTFSLALSLKYFNPLIKDFGAASPWTKDGYRYISIELFLYEQH